MKSNIQQNSLEAYEAIKPKISKMQKKIFDIIKDYGYISALRISLNSDIPINSVVPRINELMYDKQIIKIVRGVEYRGRMRAVYSARDYNDPYNVREKSYKEKYEEALAEIASLKAHIRILTN